MRAAWYDKQGPANKVLQVGEIPIPSVGPDEVLVRIRASGINPSDVKKRNGIREPMQVSRIIPHSDGAGIIEKIGSGINQYHIGQRVWIYNARWGRFYGTAAELVALPEKLLVPLPDNTSFESAACLGIPAMTAHRCVFSNGKVRDKTILITGGAGSVGHYAIQFAKWGGATVISTVSGVEKGKHAKSAGADHVLNYRKENIADKIREITNNQGVDHIVEVDFGGNLTIDQEAIRLNGCIATYASEGDPDPKLPFYPLLFKGATLNLINVYELPNDSRNSAIKDIDLMLESGILKHAIAKCFELNEIVSAHQFVESGAAIGNVILTL